MDAIVTYDLKSDSGSKNTEVKNGMKAKGYNDEFIELDIENSEKTTYYLPNTTLWKRDITPEQAKVDLLTIAEACNATVERLFAIEFVKNCEAIQGVPHSGE